MKREAERYDGYWNQRLGTVGDRCGYAPNFRRWMQSELTGLEIQGRLLEVGCGNCQFTRDLAGFSRSVSAIDISAAQIERNREILPDVEFSTHDLTEPMSFPDDTFAVIWCSEVIEHLAEPVVALREMYRVLKPGGKLLLTVPYHGMLKNVLIALFKWDDHFDPEYPHLQYFTIPMLTRLSASVGFKCIRTRTCGMRRFPRDWFVPTNILMAATK